MKNKQELICEAAHDLNSLISIVSILRGTDGCPWDREQTHQSIRKCLIEETYEVVEAIDNNDDKLMREELGDLLLQIIFHSQLESEAKRFTIDDVINDICIKMINRHPHVFSELKADSTNQVLLRWDQIKKAEKNQSSVTESLKNIPPYLPSLMRAQKLISKAQRSLNICYKTSSEPLSLVKKQLESDNKIDFGEIVFELCAAAELEKIDIEKQLYDKCDDFINDCEDIEKV